jgi:hypothetical protein
MKPDKKRVIHVLKIAEGFRVAPPRAASSKYFKKNLAMVDNSWENMDRVSA